MPRKRNPNGFTTDEAQTVGLLHGEGYPQCVGYDHRRPRTYYSPRLVIRMCDRQALEPAARVFGTSITTARQKVVSCPPELFPPDGKGIWAAVTTGKKATQIMQRLDPLLTPTFKRKWQQTLETCRQKRQAQQP